MGLINEHVGPKILAKIKIYVLTRAELLFQVCYEIPCILYLCTIFFSAVKEVSLKVPTNDWTNCGGTINEKIKVQITDDLENKCVTESIKYEVGQEMIWNSANLLSSCTEMKVDPVKSRLQGTVIEGTDEFKHCIKFLKVILDDADGTVYNISTVLLTTTTTPSTVYPSLNQGK